MWRHPYDRDVYRGLLSALVAASGRGPIRPVRAAVRMAALFLARAVGRG